RSTAWCLFMQSRNIRAETRSHWRWQREKRPMRLSVILPSFTKPAWWRGTMTGGMCPTVLPCGAMASFSIFALALLMVLNCGCAIARNHDAHGPHYDGPIMIDRA